MPSHAEPVALGALEGAGAGSPGEGFLGALQLSDSLFPSGQYTLSHGLESFAQAGLLTPLNLEDLLRDYLESVTAPSDGVALAHAYVAIENRNLVRLAEIDLRLFAMKLIREPREASCRVGRRILGTVLTVCPDTLLTEYRSWVEAGHCPGNSAVALAAAATAFGVARHEALLLQLYTFSAAFLGAAMRLIRLDHVEVQRILTRLRPEMLRLVRETLSKPLEEMRAFAPLIDLMGMAHERAHVRLFVS